MGTTRYPFLRPNPPRLSTMADRLAEIETSGIFSNYGPVNTRFERAACDSLYDGTGACLAVCNATTGLMLAIRAVTGWRSPPRRYALMPSFTFAATAHAALWCGLTPLFCDVDPDNWMPDPAAEEALLRRYAGEVAVVVPYATFGNCLDVNHYDRLSAEYGVPVVIDAAASLGSLDSYGRGFGSGSSHPVIYSMHATKTFATAEAGLIYCADPEKIDVMRKMGNFGFGEPRTATMPGLNAKLSEIGALLALAKLEGFDAIVAHRSTLAEAYRAGLAGDVLADARGGAEFSFQRMLGQRHAYQFMPVLLPTAQVGAQGKMLAGMSARGVAAGKYFSPHLAQHPFFRENAETGNLAATEVLSRRVLSLPMAEQMTVGDVQEICRIVKDTLASLDN